MNELSKAGPNLQIGMECGCHIINRDEGTENIGLSNGHRPDNINRADTGSLVHRWPFAIVSRLYCRENSFKRALCMIHISAIIPSTVHLLHCLLYIFFSISATAFFHHYCRIQNSYSSTYFSSPCDVTNACITHLNLPTSQVHVQEPNTCSQGNSNPPSRPHFPLGIPNLGALGSALTRFLSRDLPHVFRCFAPEALVCRSKS